MNVHSMLSQKGDKVVTARPDTTVIAASRLLKLERIGSVVISSDGVRVQGILSERDIVRGLVERGAELLEMPVSEIMTRTVTTCAPDDDIQDVMSKMTRGRIRHLPVVENGRLRGIISIGDVVKNRLEDLETETSVLRDYIVGRA
ncbi:MAG: CBS domain-containing protein [Rhodospirillaceae bacterium]|nr:CBS domain-containing protein [Rhodospirillaceae bacterium]